MASATQPKTARALSVLAGFAVLVGVGALTLWIGAITLSAFGQGAANAIGLLTPTGTVALVGVVMTVVGSLLTLVVSRYFQRRGELEQVARTKKIPIYEDFMAFWFKFFMSADKANALSADDMREFLTNFTQKVIVWGSDSVVRSYADFRRALITGSQDGKANSASLFVFEDLMKTMRRDLGHSNRRIRKGDLLALFINDIDKFLKPPAGDRK